MNKLKINILVGTMTGTAQLVAQELELIWDADDVAVETLLMDKLDASVVEREGVFLICTSTYGRGDVPDNAKKQYESRRPGKPGVRKEPGAPGVRERWLPGGGLCCGSFTAEQSDQSAHAALRFRCYVSIVRVGSRDR